jgi:hypothetical protein
MAAFVFDVEVASLIGEEVAIDFLDGHEKKCVRELWGS